MRTLLVQYESLATAALLKNKAKFEAAYGNLDLSITEPTPEMVQAYASFEALPEAVECQKLQQQYLREAIASLSGDETEKGMFDTLHKPFMEAYTRAMRAAGISESAIANIHRLVQAARILLG